MIIYLTKRVIVIDLVYACLIDFITQHTDRC